MCNRLQGEAVRMETRKGRQTPTKSRILSYSQTDGEQAIELYNLTGRTAQEWQELLLYDILAIDKEGLYRHDKVGYSVPRRNGKSEIIIAIELYALKKGMRVLHTAHRTTTTHSAWERLLDAVEKCEQLGLKSSYKAFGKEHIEVVDGGKVQFRTRTSKGGLGEGFDILIIDEAQEYTDDQETSLKYVVSDSSNPLTLMTGTPPTAVSSGTVFTKFRKNVLQGLKDNALWAEWSVEKMTPQDDIEAWYRTNPSLGMILTERKIKSEIGSDDIDFNIQRLGLWIEYNQKSEISPAEWDALSVKKLPEFIGELYAGIKYDIAGNGVALSIAVKTQEGKTFIETLDCRPQREGDLWIVKLLENIKPKNVIVDGANAKTLQETLRDYRNKVRVIIPSVGDIIAANALFEQLMAASQIVHMGQPSLRQSATNCEKRTIGSSGGFGYKSQREGVNIALLDSAILALWNCNHEKIKAPQRANY